MKLEKMKRDAVNAVVNSRFPEMSIEGRRLLEEALVRRKVDKGDIILDKGEIARSIILVGEGMLRQFYFKNNKDVTEHFSYEGCIVMCIESFMRQEPTRLMVEALENSIVYELSYESLHSLAEASPEFNLLYRSSKNDYKYVSDVLLDILVKSSVKQGMKPYVFDPNNSTTWTNVSTTIQAFLDSLWRQGGLKGKTASEAYYVKCDEELNPKSAQDNGILTAECGYAGSKPSEFIVVKYSHNVTSN